MRPLLHAVTVVANARSGNVPWPRRRGGETAARIQGENLYETLMKGQKCRVLLMEKIIIPPDSRTSRPPCLTTTPSVEDAQQRCPVPMQRHANNSLVRSNCPAHPRPWLLSAAGAPPMPRCRAAQRLTEVTRVQGLAAACRPQRLIDYSTLPATQDDGMFARQRRPYPFSTSV